jgi:hypothetical protein
MDDDLTNRVERALLGALITDPGLVPRLEYVEPRDFADDLHRAIYTAIRSLRHATAPSAGDRKTAVAGAAGRQVSEDYVRELAANCPNPRHATAYGLRLVQAALYRQMSQSAEALGAQAAVLGYAGARVIQVGAESGPQALDAARHLGMVSTALRRHVATLAPTGPSIAPAAELQQPGASQEQDARLVPEAGRSGRVPGQATTPTSGRRPSAASPARLASAQELREEHVLTALLRQHRESDQILSFLPAAAFTSADRQEIFRAIRRLRLASQPVDEITVVWELRVGSDTASLMRGNNDPDYGAGAGVTRLASASSTAQSPSKVARELLRQLDRRTGPDRHPARQAQPDQAPVQASPSATAGLPANRGPETGGPLHSREPRR